jgi:tetratricopeptide (TPR) repeat protein
MKRFIIWSCFCISFILISTVSGAQDKVVDNKAKANDLLRKGVLLIEEELDEKTLRKSISLFEEAKKLDPGNEDVLVEISKSFFYLGDGLRRAGKTDKDDLMEIFIKGKDAGLKAMEINKKSVGGMYWSTVNMASEGELKGVLSSLSMGGTLLNNMNRVDRRDPYYYFGATRRFGSELYIRIPGFLSERFGFSHDYIEEDLLDNIERWPDYFANYTYLARVYQSIDKDDKALEMLTYVLSNDPEKMYEARADNKLQVKYAREMWKEFTGKDWPNK